MKVVSLPISRLESDLEMAGKAPGTIQQYLASVSGFEDFLGRELESATPDDVRKWVDHLRHQAISASRLRGHYSALTFLYRKTLGQSEKVAFISMPKSDSPLPIILTPKEVQQLLDGFICAKYRTFFTLIYGTGLRIKEAIMLEVKDIQAPQQVIHVRHGKGGKERWVPMGRRLYQALRAYWAFERPIKPWLFTSNSGNCLSPATARLALLKASAVAGIGKAVKPHMLRHAFATHLYEQGVDLRKIQIVLGHGSIDSTTIYTQVSTKQIADIRSPLEDLIL